MKIRSRVVSALMAAILSAGCGTSRIAELGRVRAVHIQVQQKPAENTLYDDATSRVAASVGGSFGLIGSLVGGGVAAANAAGGRRKFSSVTVPHEETVKRALQENIGRELAHARGWRMVGAPADAEFRIDRIRYGVAHAGHQRFRAVITADCELENTNHRLLWSGVQVSESDSDWTLPEYQSRPRLYPEALTEAAHKMAVRIVEDLE